MRLDIFPNLPTTFRQMGRSLFKTAVGRLGRLRIQYVIPDIFIIVLSRGLSFYLTGGFFEPRHSFLYTALFLSFLIAIPIGTFVLMGVYDIMWRYTSLKDGALVSKAILISALINIAFRGLVYSTSTPRAAVVIQTLVMLMGMVGIRLFRRYLHEYPSHSRVKRDGIPTLIYGAGNNGSALAYRLMTNEEMGYQPVGFIDDDRAKLGRVIRGIRVLGAGPELDALFHTTGAKELIIAINRPEADLLLRIIEVAGHHGIRPLIGKLPVASMDRQDNKPLREINLNDLLSRKRRDIDLSNLKRVVPGNTILVTGAGGSIGSELAKQLFELGPQKLLLLDHSEFNLYEIDRALSDSSNPQKNVVPLLVDIKNKKMLERIFTQYSPSLVFHAAAYKHVHLVESNPFPAILNNILGTRNLLELSEEHDVESFVMISTDKAVNPAGVMGASKRVCELLVTDVAQKTGRRFSSVRFGNVLGSSGSLIPLLKEQILAGRGITITHKEMKRFFMLIPEAVSLVLRAGTLANSGDIMVLRMGEPIRIVDLATSLIGLMGKRKQDVPIVYTGIRPGEKLSEELYLTGSEIKTEDPDILILAAGDRALEARVERVLARQVDQIISDAYYGLPRAVERLYALIRGDVREVTSAELDADTRDSKSPARMFEPAWQEASQSQSVI